MICKVCGEPSRFLSESTTLVGYDIFIDELGEHHHDDNCLNRYYLCINGHNYVESLRRKCNLKGCAWKGKETCFCHEGLKVDEWTDK